MITNIEELKGVVGKLHQLLDKPEPGISAWVIALKEQCHEVMKALSVDDRETEQKRVFDLLRAEFTYWHELIPTDDTAGVHIGALGAIANVMGAVIGRVTAEDYKKKMADRDKP